MYVWNINNAQKIRHGGVICEVIEIKPSCDAGRQALSRVGQESTHNGASEMWVEINTYTARLHRLLKSLIPIHLQTIYISSKALSVRSISIASQPKDYLQSRTILQMVQLKLFLLLYIEIVNSFFCFGKLKLVCGTLLTSIV